MIALIRRTPLWIAAVLAVLLAVIAGGMAVAVGRRGQAPALVGPRAIYLALGDSVPFGFQPDFNLVQGYPEVLFQQLQPYGSERLVNMACPGATSGQMLQGGCRLSLFAKSPYTGAQIESAVAFLRANPGRVSPVTLTIGANDVSSDLGPDCAENVAAFRAHLAAFDVNLSEIVRRLVGALDGQGDLLVTTYYNPYQDACPGSTRFLRELNDHISRIARTGGARAVDIFPEFTGRTCDYTWMCSRYRDIHPTAAGHQAIAGRIAAVALAGAPARAQSKAASTPAARAR